MKKLSLKIKKTKVIYSYKLVKKKLIFSNRSIHLNWFKNAYHGTGTRGGDEGLRRGYGIFRALQRRHVAAGMVEVSGRRWTMVMVVGRWRAAGGRCRGRPHGLAVIHHLVVDRMMVMVVMMVVVVVVMVVGLMVGMVVVVGVVLLEAVADDAATGFGRLARVGGRRGRLVLRPAWGARRHWRDGRRRRLLWLLLRWLRLVGQVGWITRRRAAAHRWRRETRFRGLRHEVLLVLREEVRVEARVGACRRVYLFSEG